MSQQPGSGSQKITNFYKATKNIGQSQSRKRPLSPTEEVQQGNQAKIRPTSTSSPVKFIYSSPLSPRKVVVQAEQKTKEPKPKDIKRVLAKAKNLQDLKKSLTQFKEFQDKRKQRKAEEERVVKDETPKKKAKELLCVTPEKFYSPLKEREPDFIADVFSSPVKLTDRLDLSKKKVKKPAFERFAHLLENRPKPETLVVEKKDKGTSAVDDGKDPWTEIPLPYHLQVLSSLFTGSETVAAILTNRNETVTFTKLKRGVLQLVKSVGLKESHIGQFLQILPGCYQLERMKGNELIVKFPENYRVAGLEGRKKEFLEKCREIVIKEHELFLKDTLKIEVPAGTKIKRLHPKFNLEKGVRKTVAHPLPEIFEETPMTAQSVLEKATESHRNTLLSNSRVRKALEKANCFGSDGAKKVEQLQEQKGKLKGISQSLIEKIRAREQSKLISELTKPTDDHKKDRLKRRLPTIFPVLRNIFVSEKKVALPLDLVAQRLTFALNGQSEGDEYRKLIRLACDPQVVVSPNADGRNAQFCQVIKLQSGEEWIKMDLKVDLISLSVKY